MEHSGYFYADENPFIYGNYVFTTRCNTAVRWESCRSFILNNCASVICLAFASNNSVANGFADSGVVSVGFNGVGLVRLK